MSTCVKSTAYPYSIYNRYYSDEGLLVWKSKSYYQTLEDLKENLIVKLYRGSIRFGAVHFPDEKRPTHRSVHGVVGVLCRPLNRCNIQVRKDGKLIPWKHLL